MHAPHQVPQGAVEWALVAGAVRGEVDVPETEELVAVAVGQGDQGRRVLHGLQTWWQSGQRSRSQPLLAPHRHHRRRHLLSPPPPQQSIQSPSQLVQPVRRMGMARVGEGQ